MSLISLLYLNSILQHSLGLQVSQYYSIDGAPAPKKVPSTAIEFDLSGHDKG